LILVDTSSHVVAAALETHTLSLHDALPIWKTWHRRTRPQSNGSRASTPRAAPTSAKNPGRASPRGPCPGLRRSEPPAQAGDPVGDRKSTRLNSSHVKISYAVFCLKKKLP